MAATPQPLPSPLAGLISRLTPGRTRSRMRRGLRNRYHQYKFIVDGKWRHDETAPFMPDPLGNVNNWLFVRRIEPAPTALNK